MKRVTVYLIGCLLLVAFSSTAFAEDNQKSMDKPDGYYVTFLGGAVMLNDADIAVSGESSKLTTEYDTGYLFGVALGYKHDTQRLEGEFSYQRSDFDNISYMSDTEGAAGDQTAFAFLFNYYFDIPTKYPIKPFLTAGIGAARIDVNDFKSTGEIVMGVDDNDTVFAYQFGLGATWAMSSNLDLELKYRYFGTQDACFDDTDLEVSSHNLILGLRVAL